jgi:hypothetical protein
MNGFLESEQVVALAYQALNADTTLNTTLAVGGRIHRDAIPEGGTFPAITLQPVAAVDLNTRGGVHIWQNVQLLVKVTDRFTGAAASYVTKLIPIAKRVHVILAELTGTVDGVYVVKLRRINAPPQPPEIRAGVRYATLNQVFETEALPI